MEGEPTAASGGPRVGPVLAETFRMFFGHFLQFVAVAAIGYSPALVLRYARLLTGLTTPSALGAWASAFLDSLVFMILTQLVGGGIVYAVFQARRGNEVGVGRCLSVGAKNLGRLLAVSLIVGIVSTLGLVLCIVPGLLVFAIWSLAVPVTVVERAGVRAALDRSRALSRGHRWTILGALLLVGLIGGAASVSVAVACGGPRTYLYLAIAPLLTLLLGGLQSTAIAILYYEVRSAEGVFDVDEIAAVFE